MPRLRRSDCSRPGLVRRRHGRGFAYLDAGGGRVSDPEILERVSGLAIPPAWRDVWICLDPLGHLQATGVDAAGRKQYLYHPSWRERRDARKFDAMLEFAAALPALRRRVARDLAGTEPTRERVLACAVRLLDIGFFRVGSDDYAARGGGRGLTTILRRHVQAREHLLVFDYPAKGGHRRIQTIADPAIEPLVLALKRRRGGGEQLLAFRSGRRWHDIGADDVNAYLKQYGGGEFSAKDFRTWNATVLAALALACEDPPPATRTARRRAITRAVAGVAHYLGNTPAVCRASYIDPRVFDRFESGWTIGGVLRRIGDEPDLTDWRARGQLERATRDLLEQRDSPILERAA